MPAYLFSLTGVQFVFVVLIAQSLTFLLCAAVLVQLFFLRLEEISKTAPLLFTMAALLLVLTCLIWLYWASKAWEITGLFGHSWNRRIRRWTTTILYGLAGSVGTSAGLVILLGTEVRDLSWLSISPLAAAIALLALSFLIACLMSSLLTLGVARNHLSMRRRWNAADRNLKTLRSKYSDRPLARAKRSVEFSRKLGKVDPRPNPAGGTIVGLTMRPLYDVGDFPWCKQFEEAAEVICKEAVDALEVHSDRVEGYSYDSLESRDWKAFKFVEGGKEKADNASLCPETARLLRTIPGYPYCRDAMFSVLESGGKVNPHRDPSGLFLTMHLGLVVPKKSGICVAGMQETWEAGRCIVFDSSFEHSVWNDDDFARVILLVDFLHPEISAAEREWIMLSNFQ